MQRDVKKFVKGCLQCATGKSRLPSVRAGEMIIPQRIFLPFDTVHIDLLGPLPKTSRGNIWILTMIDAFTRWVELGLLPDSKSSTVADSFMENIVLRHGCPFPIVGPNSRRLLFWIHVQAWNW